MAKTESTAVNELISLVQGGAKQPDDPSADLFAEPKSTKVQPPARMTSTIPPMRGAGDVAPLPRGRAPQSTSNHSLTEQPPPPVRMKTASPARGTTIPSLGRASTPPPVPEPRDAKVTHSSPTVESPRITRPSLPPPKPSYPTVPSPKISTSSMPALRNTPRATLPPSEMRKEATPLPFASDMPEVMISSDNLFELTPKVKRLEETWVGKRQSRARELARMLVIPAIIAASVGTAIGVYISYRGQKPTPSASTSVTTPITESAPAPSKEIQMPVTSTAPDPNSESPNAATASAGGDEPQPPTKAEDAAKQQEAAALAAANADDPAAEPSLTRDAPVNGSAQPAVAAAQPAVAAPVIQEVKTSKGVVKLVDIRIDSKPSGATVMLVDNGKTSFLGTTPLATTVDASQQYDVVFTLQGRPTQMAHLDPSTMSRLDIKLPRSASKSTTSDKLADVIEKTASAPVEKKVEAKTVAKPDAAVETKAVATKPAEKKADAKADKKASKIADPTFDEAAELASLGEAPPPKKAAAKADAAGEGTLMISSKPPCDIYIDGKATGLTTPQRSISLPVGKHKITLVNTAEGIKKTLPVEITADKPTKLIQDLMAK